MKLFLIITSIVILIGCRSIPQNTLSVDIITNELKFNGKTIDKEKYASIMLEGNPDLILVVKEDGIVTSQMTLSEFGEGLFNSFISGDSEDVAPSKSVLSNTIKENDPFKQNDDLQ